MQNTLCLPLCSSGKWRQQEQPVDSKERFASVAAEQFLNATSHSTHASIPQYPSIPLSPVKLDYTNCKL